MSRDLDSLIDIHDAAQRIALYVKGLEKSAFQQDVKTQDAVVRCLEIIGEATKRLSPELREHNTHVPWQMMTGMRDILIHAYDKVNTDVVWETVKTSIPSLIGWIEPLISEMSESDDQ